MQVASDKQEIWHGPTLPLRDILRDKYYRKENNYDAFTFDVARGSSSLMPLTSCCHQVLKESPHTTTISGLHLSRYRDHRLHSSTLHLSHIEIPLVHFI